MECKLRVPEGLESKDFRFTRLQEMHESLCLEGEDRGDIETQAVIDRIHLAIEMEDVTRIDVEDWKAFYPDSLEFWENRDKAPHFR